MIKILNKLPFKENFWLLYIFNKKKYIIRENPVTGTQKAQMNPLSNNQSESGAKFHLHFNQVSSILEIICFQDDFLKLKQHQVSEENWSNEAKIFFKSLKKLYAFLQNNPDSLQFTQQNSLKLNIQCYLNKKTFTAIELNLIADQSSNTNLQDSLKKTGKQETSLNSAKIKMLQKELFEKTNQNMLLNKKISDLETKLKFKQIQIKNLQSQAKTLSIRQTQQAEEKTSNKTKYENDNFILTIKSANDLNRCKSSTSISKNDQKPLFEKKGSWKQNQAQSNSTLDNEINSFQDQITYKTTPVSKINSTKIKLNIDQRRVPKQFAITNLQNGNKRIEKIDGRNLGHQIVFENQISKKSSSFFRIINKQIKNNFLFVGVVLQNRRNERFFYHIKQCVSYNCANGYIWSEGKSHKNETLGKELKSGETMTVVVDGQEKVVYWYIDKRLVGSMDIGHLFIGEYTVMKIHPFVGMEGVGDWIQVINDETNVPSELEIKKLLSDETNMNLVQKSQARGAGQMLMLPQNRERAGSAD